MNHKIETIQEAITATLADIFGRNFYDICEVKKGVLHLEAIYFCHNTCECIGFCTLSIEQRLELYMQVGLLPLTTVAFYRKYRNAIENNWPHELIEVKNPEILYETLLESELRIQPNNIGFVSDKVTRDVAGAYYTSSEFAFKITCRAIDTYLEKVVNRDGNLDNDVETSGVLSKITFLDYACGCGEFLLAVMQYFQRYVTDYSSEKIVAQLHGIDVNPIAVMITVARLVHESKKDADIKLLECVAKNFTLGNPLLYKEEPEAYETRFENFALNRLYSESQGINFQGLEGEKLFIVGNPPWEKIRLEERAFFKHLCPEISAISQKHKRAEGIKALGTTWPQLAEYFNLIQCDYVTAKKVMLKHPYLKMSLVGELNTYALFAELASKMIGEEGFAAIIVKSALVTSTCYSSCFRFFVKEGALSEVFLFDNCQRIFPIDSREKFCVLFFGKHHRNTLAVHYGLTNQNDILESIPLYVTKEELELINPETGLLPNVMNADEFAFLLRMHKTMPVFAAEYPRCHFGRLVHLTAHAEQISTEPSEDRVPIYEGKFIEQYDNRFSTFAGLTEEQRYQSKASARRQLEDGFLHRKPIPEARYYIDRAFWEKFLLRYNQPYSLCWRSLTSPTNQRTMLATVMPTMPTCQSIQMLQIASTEEMLLLLALFNSKVFDYFVRLKMAGIDLTQSVVRQVPVPPKSAWSRLIDFENGQYPASNVIWALERLLYRNDSSLDSLWDGILEIKNADRKFMNAADVQEEIDKVIFRLYDLTESEEKMVRHAFS